MPDKHPSEQSKGEKAIVGVKADVKTLQQLSSSGQAAKAKRNKNQVDRFMGFLGEAVKDLPRQERQGQESSGQRR